MSNITGIKQGCGVGVGIGGVAYFWPESEVESVGKKISTPTPLRYQFSGVATLKISWSQSLSRSRNILDLTPHSCYLGKCTDVFTHYALKNKIVVIARQLVP